MTDEEVMLELSKDILLNAKNAGDQRLDKNNKYICVRICNSLGNPI